MARSAKMIKTNVMGDTNHAEIFEAEYGVVFVIDSIECHFLRMSFENCIKYFEKEGWEIEENV